jgi:hypothetical protein
MRPFRERPVRLITAGLAAAILSACSGGGSQPATSATAGSSTTSTTRATTGASPDTTALATSGTTTGATTTTRISGATMTKAEFIAQADAICADTTTKINALPAPSPTAGPSAVGPYIQMTLDILDPALQRLATLPAAPSDAKVLQQNLIAPTRVEDDAAHTFLNAMQAAQGNTTAQQRALDTFSAAAVDPAQTAHDQALSSFGFKACATTTSP